MLPDVQNLNPDVLWLVAWNFYLLKKFKKVAFETQKVKNWHIDENLRSLSKQNWRFRPNLLFNVSVKNLSISQGHFRISIKITHERAIFNQICVDKKIRKLCNNSNLELCLAFGQKSVSKKSYALW